MDMTEDNDLLLQQFFSEAAKEQVADNGFTERVMQQLPSRINWFVRLWTWCCVAVFAVLFVVFHGWELLAMQLEVFLRTLTVESFTFNPLVFATALFGLLFVGVGEVLLSEKSTY